MGPRVAILAPLALAGALAAGTAGASDPAAPAFDAGAALEASQAAIGREIGDHALTAADGSRVALSRFRGKPLVISPIYTSCYHICPTTTSHLARMAGIAASVVGEDAFAVLTVGFDTANDTPARMREYARERGIDSPQWTFAGGDAAAIAALTSDIGFLHRPTAAGFDHMIQATIVDPEGRVYRQVYGQEFEAPLLVDAIKRLVTGQRAAESTLPALLESVRLICTVFDPKSGRYRFDWSLILSAAIGLLCFGAVAVFIWRSWRDLKPTDRAA
ncbi:MAG TPA: SCO family protein [Steroidobacteraceae bacterium]|nr:SCO family protein [Steroidobacteraceae bacterium]